MVSICKHVKAKNSGKYEKTKEFKDRLFIAVSLAVVFGLGWGFGLLATNYSIKNLTLAFQYIFSLFVGSQGILLFALHGLHNTDARKVWKKWFNVITCKGKSSFQSITTKSKTNVTSKPLSTKSTMALVEKNIDLSSESYTFTLTDNEKSVDLDASVIITE